MKMIRDRFNNCNLPEAAQAAMEVVDRLQARPPEQRVVAACAVFLFLTEAAEVDFFVLFYMINHLYGVKTNHFMVPS